MTFFSKCLGGLELKVYHHSTIHINHSISGTPVIKGQCHHFTVIILTVIQYIHQHLHPPSPLYQPYTTVTHPNRNTDRDRET